MFAPHVILPVNDLKIGHAHLNACCRQGVDEGLTAKLTWEQMKMLQRLAGTDKVGRPIIMLIRQHSGQAVRVPPGWWHWVVNLQHNVKLVQDGYRDSHFTAYMQSQTLLRPFYADPTDPDDYSSIFIAATAPMLHQF